MTRAAARVLLVLSFAALAGCFHRPGTRPPAPAPKSDNASSNPNAGRYRDDRDSTPAQVPDVSKIPEPVPKDEPRSQYGNKSPYSVLGETYRVLPNCKDYVERGLASWYGNKFHGYTTSNFEQYDMYAYSAASKTLPLPCYVRVTNLENGKSVIVRVNDRGPFVANRIVDLSYVAAIKIGVWPKGTAMVEVRGIDAAHPDKSLPESRTAAAPIETRNARALDAHGVDTRTADTHGADTRSTDPHNPRAVPPTSASAPEKTPKPALYLQVGAFSDAANAERAANAVRAARLGEVRVVEADVNGKPLRRVRLGPLRDADEADRVTPKLRALGLGEPRVAVDN